MKRVALCFQSLFVTSVICFCGDQAFGALEIGAGGLGKNLGNVVATEETGEGGMIGSSFPYFWFQWRDDLALGESGFLVGAGSTLVGRLDFERTSIETVYRLHGKWVLPLGESFSFGVGPSLEFSRISGAGGSNVIENGNSTSNFPLPGRSATSAVWSLDLQTAYRTPLQSLSLVGELWIQNLFGQTLSASALAAITYRWGGQNE